MSAAGRKRRQREREKRGEVIYRLPLRQDETVEYLIATNRIGEQAALDHAAVERALAVLFGDLVARWLNPVTRDFQT